VAFLRLFTPEARAAATFDCGESIIGVLERFRPRQISLRPEPPSQATIHAELARFRQATGQQPPDKGDFVHPDDPRNFSGGITLFASHICSSSIKSFNLNLWKGVHVVEKSSSD
jgi:hypothetical protein